MFGDIFYNYDFLFKLNKSGLQYGGGCNHLFLFNLILLLLGQF